MNLMGFKRVSSLPPRRRCGIYDELLEEVSRSGDIYVLDTHDRKRARSLQATLRNRIKFLEEDNVKVVIRDTKVCLVAKNLPKRD